MIKNLIGLFIHPVKVWEDISSSLDSVSNYLFVLLVALVPCISWYYGITQVGWVVGDGEGEITRMTADSALPIMVLFYFVIISAVATVGWFIHWMAKSYGAESSTIKGISMISYTSFPLILAGVFGFYPVFWFHLAIALAALMYSLYLLEVGLPVIMGISKERGFLFVCAVVAVCMVMVIALLGATVVLWDMGFTPVFID